MKKHRVNASDVAKKAGVSRTTVSFVINNVKKANISPGTREKVLQAAEELGYIPNAAGQALASQKTRNIGFIYSSSLIAHPFSLHTIEGLTEITRKENLRLIIDSPESTPHVGTLLNLVRAKHIDGLVLKDSRIGDPELHLLAEEQFPVVLIGYLPSEKLCSIDINNRKAARAVTRHLIDIGHKRIAFINVAPVSYTMAQSRMEGYIDALQENGYTIDKEYMRNAEFSPQSGYMAMKDILQSCPVKPTAVFVASDMVAFGVIKFLHEAKLDIPGDMAVAGFDDIPLANFACPPLTSVHFEGVAEGRRAGELLIELIDEKIPPGYHEELDSSLVIRQSTVAGLKEDLYIPI